MLALKIGNYWHGTVRIRICGAIPERLINLCLSRGIVLWNIRKQEDRLTACLRLADFFRLRPLVRLSRCRIDVIGRSGLPFVAKRIKRRKMMVAGAVLFLIVLHVLSSFIWFVDVTGNSQTTTAEIRQAVAEHGLRPGAKRGLIDTKEIENSLLLRLPQLAWVGINLSGTRAVVEVVEKTLARPEDKSPANLVAAKDGVIEEIIVIAGQAAVKKGDTVRRGDVLVRGFISEPPVAEEPGQPPVISLPEQYVRAKGIIKAHVWYEGYGEAALVQEYNERTGRQLVAVTVAIGQHHFVLKQVPEQPFARFEAETVHKKLVEWRNRSLIVESTICTFHELAGVPRELSPDEAKNAAKSQALKAVQDIIPETAQVLARRVEILKTAETGLIRAKVAVETIEDIGQTMSIIQ